jgi:hypothetical protein
MHVSQARMTGPAAGRISCGRLAATLDTARLIGCMAACRIQFLRDAPGFLFCVAPLDAPSLTAGSTEGVHNLTVTNTPAGSISFDIETL